MKQEEISTMVKQVGNTEIKENHRASCHCGAVVLELYLPNGIENRGVVTVLFVVEKGQ